MPINTFNSIRIAYFDLNLDSAPRPRRAARSRTQIVWICATRIGEHFLQTNHNNNSYPDAKKLHDPKFCPFSAKSVASCPSAAAHHDGSARCAVADTYTHCISFRHGGRFAW
eukprot:SAG31_NODE_5574_length_2448_cov_3.162197_5_plen_112_part_00